MRLRISTAVLLFGLFAVDVLAQEAPPPIKRESAPGLLPEPAVMANAIDMAGMYVRDDGSGSERGFYPVLKDDVTGAGWISVGSGYRRRALNRRAVLDGFASYSLHGYKTAQAKVELIDLAGGHVVVGSQALYQDLTQLRYFGIGPDSQQVTLSDYRLRTTDLTAYGSYRPLRWLSFEGEIGRLGAPRVSASTGPFDQRFPDAPLMFVSDPGFDVAKQPGFVRGELSLTADSRDYPGHPSSGGLYRLAWSRYADRDLNAFSFDLSEIEATRFVPVVPGRWIVAVHGWTVIADTAAGQRIPVYLLPSLGGSTTLRSFADYRFHDRDVLLLSAESRWALFSHIDAAVFIDAGSVASRFRDLDLDKRSYGFGFRVHTHTSTAARLDFARGEEGWRALFRLNDPFRLTKLTRHTAPIPFVP
jgi:hypothetical protein